MSIEDYYAKTEETLGSIGVKLILFQHVECGKCTCNITTKLEKREENANDGLYETVRSTLLAADDVGGINKIYSSLIREERLRMGYLKTISERAEIMSFAVQSGGKYGSQ